MFPAGGARGGGIVRRSQSELSQMMVDVAVGPALPVGAGHRPEFEMDRGQLVGRGLREGLEPAYDSGSILVEIHWLTRTPR